MAILSAMSDRRRQRALPRFALSAFASGAAALALELLWGRELALTFGSSQYAVAAVLAAFMTGLGIGSAWGGRLADRVQRPAAVVAGIELALAIAGPLWSLALLRLPALSAVVLPAAEDATRWPFLLGRLGLGVAVLLPPTLLMGASFPLLARASAPRLAELHHNIGVLVAAATLGGVVGATATGLLVLPTGGVLAAAAAAAMANLVAAAAALRGQSLTNRRREGRTDEPADPEAAAPGAAALLGAAAASGALVLGAETVWHRALMMVMANSTATLTLLLAITLAGLGVGAWIGTPLLNRVRPLERWAVLQSGAGALLVGQAVLLPQIAAAVRAIRPDTGWARVLVPPLAVGGGLILPAALVLGAAWPLLLAAATPRLSDSGRRLGIMGVVNSIGAGTGAVAIGFVALPALGFGRTLLLLAGTHLVLAALAWRHARRRWLVAIGAAGLVAAAALGPRFAVVPLPSTVGRSGTEILAYRESPAGTVVVTEDSRTGSRAMYVDNNAVIGSSYEALKIVRMLGLVPSVLHPSPEHVLVIGYGAGVTTATIAAIPGVDRIDVAEIVPDVITAARSFDHLNHRVDTDPRVRMVANDGRNVLLLSDARYDIITCDPVHPLYGSAPLYSLQYFELCRRRLRPGGIVCQYLPLHRMPTAEFRRAIATFGTAFHETWVMFGLGHAMLLGAEDPLVLDWPRWQRVLDEYGRREDLAASSLATPAQIAALLQLDPEGSRRIAYGEPSTDRHPRLEFLAPAAYRPGLWAANARLLVEGYTSPLDRIRNLPPELREPLRRLVAGKRLLLFSLLERDAGNTVGATTWIRQALAVAGDDPEIQHYARQLTAEVGR